MTITGTSTQMGWYFYGITREGPLAAASESTSRPLMLLRFAGLAAVVAPVQRDDFSLAAMQERLRDPAALEAMVRSHNNVVEAVHAQQPILPAKFGIVYAETDDVVSALRPTHDTLLDQLSRLDGCDEWAVHLYADRNVFGERIASSDDAIRALREKRAAARPGRAYFLEQQLRSEQDAAADRALTTVARNTFDHLAGCAVAAQLSEVKPAELAGEVEILRASFLVRRDAAGQFKDEVDSSANADGLRSEYSGPWPPYSFAAHEQEGAQ